MTDSLDPKAVPFSVEPDRATVENLPGRTLLEFGAGWCSVCQAARPDIEAWLAGQQGLRHLRIEDGKGRRLGRSYGVKLWPTLILLQDGAEVARIVRPENLAALRGAFG